MMIDVTQLLTTITQSSQPQTYTEWDVLAAYAPYIGVLILLFPYMLFRRLGGWPEAYYRISRIPYFIARFFLPGGDFERKVFKEADLKHGSLPNATPSFEYDGGKYFVRESGPSRGSENGRAAYWYNWDDGEPIPILDWKKGSKWDPFVVRRAFKSKVVSEMHYLGDEQGYKPGKTPWALIFVVLMVAVLLAGVSAYFAYNNYCAFTPARCAFP